MFPKYLPLVLCNAGGSRGVRLLPWESVFVPLYFPRVLAITNIGPIRQSRRSLIYTHTHTNTYADHCAFSSFSHTTLTHCKICYHSIKCIRNLRKRITQISLPAICIVGDVYLRRLHVRVKLIAEDY